LVYLAGKGNRKTQRPTVKNRVWQESHLYNLLWGNIRIHCLRRRRQTFPCWHWGQASALILLVARASEVSGASSIAAVVLFSSTPAPSDMGPGISWLTTDLKHLISSDKVNFISFNDEKISFCRCRPFFNYFFPLIKSATIASIIYSNRRNVTSS
jgi:hypothetical protein